MAEKPRHWVGSVKKDPLAFPAEAVDGIGYADADERKLRVQLAMRVNELIPRSGLTQVKTAALFGIPQPHVSALKQDKPNGFRRSGVMHLMTLLERDVEILIRPRDKARSKGEVSVLFAA